MTFERDIKASRKKLGWSQEKLAKELGVGQSSVSDWEKGSAFPRQKQWGIIKDVLGLNMGVYFIGEHISLAKKSLEIETNIHHIPFLGKVGAGYDRDLWSNSLSESGEAIDIDDFLPKNTFAVELEGDSQFPFLRSGSTVLLGEKSESPYLHIDKLCVCKLEGDTVVIKTIGRGTKNGMYNLLSADGDNLHDVTIEWVFPIVLIIPKM